MTTNQERTFTQTSDDVADAAAFFARVTQVCETQAVERTDERDRMFLDHVGRATRILTDDLQKLRAGAEHETMRRWRQYRPPHPIPSGDELTELGDHRRDVEDFLSKLQDATRAWESLHTNLEETADNPEVAEFHASYREVMTRYRRDLNSAYQRGQDM